MKHKVLNKNLPSFTIIEMLIVMLLSAIVVGLTYLYFSQFSHYLRNTEQTSDNYINFNQFNFVFEKDLDDATEIYYQAPDRLRLVSDDYEIVYQLQSEYAKRELETSDDSFCFGSLNIDIRVMEEYNDLVQQIGFEALLPDSNTVGFFYLKEYPASVLFNRYNKSE